MTAYVLLQMDEQAALAVGLAGAGGIDKLWCLDQRDVVLGGDRSVYSAEMARKCWHELYWRVA